MECFQEITCFFYTRYILELSEELSTNKFLIIYIIQWVDEHHTLFDPIGAYQL